MPARRRLAEFFDEDDALGLERVDDVLVVHDLVAHIDRGPVKLERSLNRLDCAHHAGAESTRRAQDHAQRRLCRHGGQCARPQNGEADALLRAQGRGVKARKPVRRSLPDEPGRNASPRGSIFLTCRPEQDLVDVHVLRLAHREHDHVRKGVSGNGRLLVELGYRGGAIGVVDAVGQFGRDRARRNIVVRML